MNKKLNLILFFMGVLLMFIAACIVVSMLLGLSGCAKEEKLRDINIAQSLYARPPTQQWLIFANNGYHCISLNQVKNQDGSYTITFVFDNYEQDEVDFQVNIIDKENGNG